MVYELISLWQYGIEQWLSLDIIKESNPVEVSEFDRARKIEDEPIILSCFPNTFRDRDQVISTVKSRVRKALHKYCIEVPIFVEHAKKNY